MDRNPQYFIQNDEDIRKEKDRKAETAKHDAELRKEYETSVFFMKRDFDASSDKTLKVIGQILAKQNDSLDISNKRIVKLMHDSGNIKMVFPNQPVLDVIGIPPHPGIEYLKFQDGLYHYDINFMSQDGSSCCYDIKISAVVADTATIAGMHRLIYKSIIAAHLTDADNLAKDESQNWRFTIDNSDSYDVLYLWVRGTYYDRAGSHRYTIDQIYFNRKSSNSFGSMGLETKKAVSALVHHNEK